jgi:hypothetical protein
LVVTGISSASPARSSSDHPRDSHRSPCRSCGPAAQLDDHLGQHRSERALFVLVAEVLLGLLADLVGEVQRDVVVHLQRTARHAGGAADIVDDGRGDALGHHLQAFLHEGAEAARGVEAAAVVDDDRGLLDLQDVVDRLGQGFLAGLPRP